MPREFCMKGKSPEQVSRESFTCQFQADYGNLWRFHELGSLSRIATALEKHNRTNAEVVSQLNLIREELRALRSDRALIAPTKK